MPKITLRLSTGGGSKPSIKIEPRNDEPKRLPKIKFKQPHKGTRRKRRSSSAKKVKISQPKIRIRSSKKTRMPTIRVKPTMIPGDGYDSEDPEREDDPLIEEGIILRVLPDESLDTLRASVETGDMSGIAVKWKDRKRAVLKIHGVLYGGKLVNLPTIVEVHKSLDRKTMYKTFDVCQMLLMVKKLNTEEEVNDIPVDIEYGETYPDGITPGMQNCKTRFGERYQEQVIQNVEDEVDRLLKLDEQSESTSYEFIDASMLNSSRARLALSSINKKKKKRHHHHHRKQSKSLVADDQQQKSADHSEEGNEEISEEEEGRENVAQEGKQSEEEIDNELDKLIEEEEEEEEGETSGAGEETDRTFDDGGGLTKAKVEEEEEGENEEIVEGLPTETEPEEEDGEEDDEEEEEDEEDEDEDEEDEDEEDHEDEGKGGRTFGKGGEVDENKQHNAIIREEISELDSTISQKEKDLAKANNPIMRNRINDVISRLRQELDIKKSQIVVEKDSKTGNENKHNDNNGGNGSSKTAHEEEEEDEDADEEAEEDDNDDLADLF